MRSIVITGNCTADGIALALHALFPEANVRAIPVWEMADEEGLIRARAAIAAADVWVRTAWWNNHLLADSMVAGETVDIPALYFPAFHPDMVYAHLNDGRLLRSICDYHSAIALWAWRRGLDASDAERLFSHEVMRKLGYDEYWAASYEGLRAMFDQSSLEFFPFWLRVKRLGVFMHTINHPKIGAVSLLAKSVAVALGASATIWDDPVDSYIPDGMTNFVWPVYPMVGTTLGVPSGLRWRLDDVIYPNLTSFLGATWASYEGVDTDAVVCERLDDARYDAVLSAAIEERHRRTSV